ncbi:DUF5659 domain-containing protein [Clostridium baratii]|uniref:DUF5659 domain-containing protein n=1 Tax=Clostridium baratii TaxID=1561 RepID=UPI0030CFEA2F
MYIVKTLRLMNYLVRKGFDCKKIEKDRYNAAKVVFKFEDCKELRQALYNYKSR